MATSITIRDVPDDARDELAARAALSGRSLQEYLRAQLIDELHLAFRPILMGCGENLFAGIDLTELGYRCTEHVSTEFALHVTIQKDA